MKPKLTIDLLQKEAGYFSGIESKHKEPGLFGVTDGKAVGTYLEPKNCIRCFEFCKYFE